MGPQQSAVARDLQRLAPEDQGSGLAALALRLARYLDEGVPMREIAPIARELRGALADLAALAKPAEVEDDLSRLRGDRAERRGEAV